MCALTAVCDRQYEWSIIRNIVVYDYALWFDSTIKIIVVHEHAPWLSSLHSIVFMVICLLVVAVVYYWKQASPPHSRVVI